MGFKLAHGSSVHLESLFPVVLPFVEKRTGSEKHHFRLDGPGESFGYTACLRRRFDTPWQIVGVNGHIAVFFDKFCHFVDRLALHFREISRSVDRMIKHGHLAEPFYQFGIEVCAEHVCLGAHAVALGLAVDSGIVDVFEKDIAEAYLFPVARPVFIGHPGIVARPAVAKRMARGRHVARINLAGRGVVGTVPAGPAVVAAGCYGSLPSPVEIAFVGEIGIA